MRITGLDHVQVAMPPGGEQMARKFYGQVLGLKETAKPAALHGRGGCWFTGPSLHLHLGVQEDFVPATKAHPAFLVSDLDALKRRLEGANHPVQPDDRLSGVRRFYVSDPFGNRLEFIQEGGGLSQPVPAGED